MTQDAFQQLMSTIVHRRDHPARRSYTQQLLAGGDQKICEKIQEEAAEVCQAAMLAGPRPPAGPTASEDPVASDDPGSRQHLIHEAADLIYHLWVLLAKHHIELDELQSELARRAGVSGLEEKDRREPR